MVLIEGVHEGGQQQCAEHQAPGVGNIFECEFGICIY